MSALLCFFCGGKDCKYENWRVWSDVAIEGLYSSWITDTILATARPSTRLMKAHSIVKSFQQKNITAVFCLQEPGEHASCGDGVQSNGWSYNVEDFMDAGIHWYWFGWRDMDVPDVKHMLRLVQVMASVIEIGGGIAVHCHAGLGRTGLAIACYLVYDGWHADKVTLTSTMHS
ncbi:protein-tyrosine phosphatase-like protein [Gaertneriomyces semiglobifer]|nr:protein-tyrosine phosphatase-like protein [Gaertneriomyces semiglobifer]